MYNNNITNCWNSRFCDDAPPTRPVARVRDDDGLHPGASFAHFTQRENFAACRDGLLGAFEYFGGVPAGLAALSFIERAENIVLLGFSGVGKNDLTVALATVPHFLLVNFDSDNPVLGSPHIERSWSRSRRRVRRLAHIRSHTSSRWTGTSASISKPSFTFSL